VPAQVREVHRRQDLDDLSLPVQFFMMTPGPIYAAGFLLTVVG
jgi:hypothetical protein